MVLCPAMHVKVSVTLDAAWSDVHAKNSSNVSSTGASQLQHRTRRDSAAELAISLLQTLPAAASSYLANLQLHEAAFCEQLYHVMQSPNAMQSCSQSQ